LPQLRVSHYRDKLPFIPSDFSYKGRPIEPVCIRNLLEDAPKRVPLTSCLRPVKILDCVLSDNHDADPWWDLRGYLGYCYLTKDRTSGASSEQQLNIVYKYLGKLEGHHAVLAEWGAGTSSVSVDRRVVLIDVENLPPALMLIKILPSGSFVPIDARIVAGKLFHTAAVQGVQFAELAGLDPGALAVSQSDFPRSRRLADSDIAEFENGVLKRVVLLPYGPAPRRVNPGDDQPPRRASCFVQTHQRYLGEQRTELSPGALRTFVAEVLACAKTAPRGGRG
jgi:hypothetical protein